MRIRSIKPEFWKSERVASLPRDSRLLFIGLWNLADDAGRFRAHPNLIQGELFPYEPESDVAGWLQALVDAGLVLLYEADGRRYGLVVGFAEHQKIDKRTESRLPPPPSRRRAPSPIEEQAAPAEPPKPAPAPFETRSAESPEESAEPDERSAADRIRDQGLDQGEEQAPERARGRARGAGDPPAAEPAATPEPARVAKSRDRDNGESPVADLTTALLATRYRGGISNAIRRRGMVRDEAARLVETGLTADRVPELAALADAKSSGDPGGLLAHWLDQGLWREVLDEHASKAKVAGLQATARAAAADVDVLEGIYGGSEAMPAAAAVGGVLAAARKGI